MTWLAPLLTALANSLTAIVEFFLKREERARETVTPPQKPTTVEEVKRKHSAGSANGSPPAS